MGAPELLAHLRSLGLTVSNHGGKLRAEPKGAVTPPVVDLIRQHRDELLSVLEVRSWGWRITHLDGRTIEHYIVPIQTLAEVQAYYPGAVIEPVIEVAADTDPITKSEKEMSHARYA